MSLPLTMAFVAMASVATWVDAPLQWFQLGVILLSALLMVELNNANALIRTYSRMVSCTFLLLSLAVTTAFVQAKAAVVGLCFIAFYLQLFRTYQQKQAAGHTFYAFVLLGVCSLAFVHVVFLLPVIWFMMATKLMSLSWKTFISSIFGLLMPYWFVVGISVYTQQTDSLWQHFALLGIFSRPVQWQAFAGVRAADVCWLLMLYALGSIHFLRTSFLDKIRTRMLFEWFITMSGVLWVFLLAQPQHFEALMWLLLINISPLIAHFITLTRTRITNITFMVITAITLLLTIYHLWILL